MENNNMEKTSISFSVKANKNTNFKKAIADYMSPVTDAVPQEMIIGDPDLMYNTSVLVSEGSNSNSDGFLRSVLMNAFRTPRNKFVNFEHDTHGQNDKKNPNGYQIVGHIYDSRLQCQDGLCINDSEVYFDSDGKWLSRDSMARGRAVDIVVDWVMYQFEFPEIAEMIAEQEAAGASAEGFGVSMEVLFSDYKFRVGQFDPDEDFDFDASSVGAIEARKGTPMAETLKTLWEKRQGYNGQPITRILGGKVIFSGMAITGNRANKRSINLSIDKSYASGKESEIEAIIKAVAARSGAKTECKIENGEPDCDCLENTLASQLEILKNELAELSVLIKKTSNTSVAEDDDDEEDNDIIEDYLKLANKKLQELYENNIENELSGEEVEEYLELVEKYLLKSRSIILKHI